MRNLEPIKGETKIPDGTQIAYVPLHIREKYPQGEIPQSVCWDERKSGGVELGFVTSTNERFVFCRYWKPDNTLKNIHNSEPTNRDDLFYYDHKTDKTIRSLLAAIRSKAW